MSGRTSIEWTERTWNPTRGCSMAQGSNSPECGGCYNCYAARQALRMAGPGGTYEGLVKLTPHGPRWTGKVVLAEDQLDAPLRVKKPTMWFVNSMSDLFHESLPDETIDRVFAVMALCPQHTFQVLTKRAERMADYVSDEACTRVVRTACGLVKIWPEKLRLPERSVGAWPLPNVWLGVSCETQPMADARVPHLLRTSAAVRFVSLEPFVGPIDIVRYLLPHDPDICGCERDSAWCPFRLWPGVDWVIIGGESGPGARPLDLAWARQIIEQCKAAHVPVFMKQLGAAPIEKYPEGGGRTWKGADKKGGDPSEWPADLCVREFPTGSESSPG